jgi:hypothetical protein
MSHLKFAYELGQKLAYEETGLVKQSGNRYTPVLKNILLGKSKSTWKPFENKLIEHEQMPSLWGKAMNRMRGITDENLSNIRAHIRLVSHPDSVRAYNLPFHDPAAPITGTQGLGRMLNEQALGGHRYSGSIRGHIRSAMEDLRNSPARVMPLP